MPQKTPQCRVLSLQRLLPWFPFLLNHSKVSREISGIASDWNSYSWDWNCPCASSICRERTLCLGGWCEWMKCFVPPGWNKSSRKFSFLHPLLSFLITHRFPILSLPIKKQCQGGGGGWKPHFKHWHYFCDYFITYFSDVYFSWNGLEMHSYFTVTYLLSLLHMITSENRLT